MKKTTSFLQRYSLEIIAVFFTLLGLVLRTIHRRCGFNTDEVYQIKRCTVGLREFLQNFHVMDHCRYLNADYIPTFIFVHIFGENKWGLAIPHMVATLILFLYLYRICRQSFSTIWGYLPAFAIVSLNETLINHAFEIRFYPVLPMASLLLYYYTPLLMDPAQKLGKRVAIGAFAIATCWYQALGLYVVFFITLYWFLVKWNDAADKKKFFLNAVLNYLFIFGIALPFWLYNVIYTTLNLPFLPTFAYIPNPLLDFIGFLKGIFGNLVGNKKLYFLLAGFVALLLPGRHQFKQIIFLLVLIALPLSLILYGDFVRQYWFLQKQFIWIMPLFAILMGSCWETLALFIQKK